MTRRVLIAGESWVVHSIHQKGYDSFTTTDYAEGVGWLRAALQHYGWTVDYMPSHTAMREFPATVEALRTYNTVILSDIGANTLLLHPDTFSKSIVTPNRLHALRDYVQAGGGLVMAGGYLTFQGIEAKGQYAGSAVEEALPVTLMREDDRIESPQGVTPNVADASHPIIRGIIGLWPALLGYNRVTAKAGASLVAKVGNDPLLVAKTYGKGRGVAFTSDCAPHWAPPSFLDWPGYGPLWNGIVEWAGSLR